MASTVTRDNKQKDYRTEEDGARSSTVVGRSSSRRTPEKGHGPQAAASPQVSPDSALAWPSSPPPTPLLPALPLTTTPCLKLHLTRCKTGIKVICASWAAALDLGSRPDCTTVLRMYSLLSTAMQSKCAPLAIGGVQLLSSDETIAKPANSKQSTVNTQHQTVQLHGSPLASILANPHPHPHRLASPLDKLEQCGTIQCIPYGGKQ